MRDLNLLRYVPATTPVHRLWAGTKAIGVLVVGIGVGINPTWPAEAVLGALLALTLGLARIPWGARPRLPAWLVWLWIGVGAALALIAGGKPYLHVAGTAVGLGSLNLWARFVVLALLILLSAAVLAWTTPMSELAPAFSRLGLPFTKGPLARLRVPVGEVAVILALSVRCVTLLSEELRLLVAARKVRGRPRQRGWAAFEEAVDLLVATVVVATRRAGEMAEAMEARGGLPARLSLGRRPGWGDALALTVVAAALAGILLV
jgi:energy-coupling factor transport system permease protein